MRTPPHITDRVVQEVVAHRATVQVSLEAPVGVDQTVRVVQVVTSRVVMVEMVVQEIH
jgi:hypothetical protein